MTPTLPIGPFNALADNDNITEDTEPLSLKLGRTMKLTYLYTSGSNSGSCPTLYETDTGDIVVQGYQLTDKEALTQLRDVLPGENFVVVPRGLIARFPTGH